MHHHAHARRVYLLMSAGYAFCFFLIVSVNLIYQATAVGLGALQLVAVGAVLETVCLICEVPTGLIADVHSRRLSIVLGVALTGAGFTVEGLVPSFSGVVAGNVLYGVGATFCSGAEQAWLNDELGERAAAPAMLRATQLGNAGGLAGILAAIALAQISISLPIVVGGVGLGLLAACLALVMPEHGFRPLPPGERRSLRALGATLNAGAALVRRRPMLRRVLAVGLAFGAFSEASDRLSTAHVLRDVGTPTLGGLPPVVWLGGLFAVQLAVGIVAVGRVASRLETGGGDRLLAMLRALYALMAATNAVFALARRFGVAAGSSLAGGISRNVQSPLYQIALNAGLEPRSRATVNSFAAQSDALGQIGGGLALGALAGAGSITLALLAGSALLMAAPLLLRRDRVEIAPGR